MEHSRIFRILGIAFILSLLMAAIPVMPALATTYSYDITLDPAEGAIGDTITISGVDFPYDPSGVITKIVSVYFSSQDVALNKLIIPAGGAGVGVKTYKSVATQDTVQEDADVGYFETTFTVPSSMNDGDDHANVSEGTYYVYVTVTNDNSSTLSPTIRAKAEFTVTSSGEISLDPETGPAGTSVTISGTHFPASKTIAVKYDTTAVSIVSGNTKTTSIGAFDSTITIPSSSTTGAHTITVTAGTTSNTATFTVTASTTLNPLSPTSGPAGTAVTVSGTRFLASYPIIFKFDTTTIAPTSGDANTSTSGSFTSTITIPPAATAATHTIYVTVGTVTLNATFTVTASTTLNPLSPTSGPAGTAVTVSGTRFLASYPIIFKFDTTTIAPTSGDVNTSTSGGFTSTITIPPAATAATHTIYVTVGSVMLNATFTVTAGTPTPPPASASLSLSQTSGTIGTSIIVSDIGFTPNATVTITYDDQVVATTTALTNGIFMASFQVPPSKSGEHTITATGGTKTSQNIFTIAAVVPAAPPLLLPATEARVKSPVAFDWGDITAANPPATYTLQIATSNNFTIGDIVLEKPGITESQYTLTEEDSLKLAGKETPYYWRVKATDAASNEGDWTAASTFYIAPPVSLTTGWPLFIMFVVVAVVFFGVGYWVGRKTAFSY